jgi:hypothetical protein
MLLECEAIDEWFIHQEKMVSVKAGITLGRPLPGPVRVPAWSGCHARAVSGSPAAIALTARAAIHLHGDQELAERAVKVIAVTFSKRIL